MFKPRPRQAEVLAYKSGRMGVSAVPGSGKTRTLSYLAANLVAGKRLKDDQEVLIVTLVNSAVDHFARQVGAFVQEHGLLPNLGYRVRTLHGLANDIVRERPGLVGLSERFQIIDEREADDILQDAVTAWVRANPDAGEPYLDYDLDENRVAFILRDHWPQEVVQIARVFIKQAKDRQLTPEDIRRGLDHASAPLPLAWMCYAIYVNYQHGLSYRGAVDFQDLIRLALRILELDKDYLKRLRQQWPYILEDEAQDSSLLQERILRLLVGPKGNWVRVGDPNQAIYETFTTARPEYLRTFLREDGVQARELPNSGRSTRSIIELANYLIDWTQTRHPVETVRARAPLQPPQIEPTPEGDPQPNPEDRPGSVHLHGEPLTAADEIEIVVRSLRRWLPENQDKTAAVLVPRNDRGAQFVRALKTHSIEVVELLRSTSSTRETAGALVFLLETLSNPNASTALARAYRVWRRDDRDDPDAAARVDRVVKVLQGCKQVEDYLWPRLDRDWLDGPEVTELTGEDDLVRGQLEDFRRIMRRWQAAVILPIDQLVLTLAGDLFVTASDLAIAHNLAVYLRRAGQTNPHWRLPDFAGELKMVAQNKRRVVDLGEDATGYDPEKHKGKVTIATMHSAKGLEWDRVYLVSVNNYDFPSAEPQDRFIAEKWYVRDRLNLQAEALAQLRTLEESTPYIEGQATQDAREEYAAERLRLLYVGITRARRELMITWNTGRDGKLVPATPLIGLQTWWEGERA
jgi:DNA helicase II / ATP-dependent DNA helicase PcrA